MIANQGSFDLFKYFRKNTVQVIRKDPWLLDAWDLHDWIGRGDIVSHFLSVQETNSRLGYHTHTHVISRGMPKVRTRLTNVRRTLGVSKHLSDGTP